MLTHICVEANREAFHSHNTRAWALYDLETLNSSFGLVKSSHRDQIHSACQSFRDLCTLTYGGRGVGQQLRMISGSEISSWMKLLTLKELHFYQTVIFPSTFELRGAAEIQALSSRCQAGCGWAVKRVSAWVLLRYVYVHVCFIHYCVASALNIFFSTFIFRPGEAKIASCM